MRLIIQPLVLGKKLFNHYKNTYKIGCTATPERLDGKGLGDYFDDLIVRPDTIQLLLNKEYLAAI